MDIAAMSMSSSLAGVQQSASLSVTKKAMDTQEVEAAGLMQMLETAAPSQMSPDGVGQNVDVLA